MNLTRHIHRVLDACDDFLAKLPGGPGGSHQAEDLRQVGLDLVVRSMAVMCSVDGRLDDDEIETSVGIYQSQTGYELSRDQIRMTVSTVSLESDLFWHDLKIKGHMLPAQVCREIFNASRAVAYADKVLHPAESVMLERLEDALGLDRVAAS